jgi:hypothetical protein
MRLVNGRDAINASRLALLVAAVGVLAFAGCGLPGRLTAPHRLTVYPVTNCGEIGLYCNQDQPDTLRAEQLLLQARLRSWTVTWRERADAGEAVPSALNNDRAAGVRLVPRGDLRFVVSTPVALTSSEAAVLLSTGDVTLRAVTGKGCNQNSADSATTVRVLSSVPTCGTLGSKILTTHGIRTFGDAIGSDPDVALTLLLPDEVREPADSYLAQHRSDWVAIVVGEKIVAEFDLHRPALGNTDTRLTLVRTPGMPLRLSCALVATLDNPVLPLPIRTP